MEFLLQQRELLICHILCHIGPNVSDMAGSKSHGYNDFWHRKKKGTPGDRRRVSFYGEELVPSVISHRHGFG